MSSIHVYEIYILVDMRESLELQVQYFDDDDDDDRNENVRIERHKNPLVHDNSAVAIFDAHRI